MEDDGVWSKHFNVTIVWVIDKNNSYKNRVFTYECDGLVTPYFDGNLIKLKEDK